MKKSDIADLSKENKVLQDHLVSTQRVSERNRVAIYRINQRMDVVCSEKVHFQSRMQELEATAKNLNDALDIAKTERDGLTEHITELGSEKVKIKQHS